jgi:hypothetical protein
LLVKCAEIQGSNYNLERGLIARFQKFSDQIEKGHFHHLNGVVLKGRCSSSSLNQRPFSTVKAERRCSSKSTVSFSYGCLNGGRPLAYRLLSTRRALYKPSGTEEQRVGESEIKTKERDRKKNRNKTDTNQPEGFLSFLVKLKIRSEPFPHQYRPKTVINQTDRERV